MNLLVKALPIECVWHPRKTVCPIEESHRELPAHVEGIHEEEVPGDRHETVIEAVWIFEIDGGVFDVVA